MVLPTWVRWRILPHDLLGVLGNGDIRATAPSRWAFLDTETTGLAGGTGTYAFLIGVGRITQEGFKVRQFFMREYSEERSILAALQTHLNDFDVLITYNGKSYDQPLLETRYLMTRGEKPPFVRLGHLDLLHGARRLWKLRIASCRLMELRNRSLVCSATAICLEELIPYVYFEYLRSHEARRLVPIFHHNAMDILTLGLFNTHCGRGLSHHGFRVIGASRCKAGEDLAGIARWLIAAQDYDQALNC